MGKRYGPTGPIPWIPQRDQDGKGGLEELRIPAPDPPNPFSEIRPSPQQQSQDPVRGCVILNSDGEWTDPFGEDGSKKQRDAPDIVL